MNDPHSDDDSLDRALREMPDGDLDSARRERVRRAAHRALDAGAPSMLATLYHRLFEPALVLGVSVAYLAWAFQRVADVLLGF